MVVSVGLDSGSVCLMQLTITRVDRLEYQKARELWKETRDPEAALAIFPKRAYSERKLLSFYSRTPDNHAKAIKSVSRS